MTSSHPLPRLMIVVGALLFASCGTAGTTSDECLLEDYCEDGRYRCGESDRTAPISTPTTDVVQLEVGRYGACVVRSGGSLRCWGGTRYGIDAVPVDLGPVQDVDAFHTRACAVTTSGGVRCWNALGDTTDVPADIGPASAVETGLSATCALLQSGGVRCWNVSPDLALSVDSLLATVDDAVDLGMGQHHGCLRRATGQVLCWATQTDGEPYAALPDDLGSARDLTVGERHACVILEVTGRAQCWGDTFDPPLTRLDDLGLIDAGAHTNCTVNGSGSFECWDDIYCNVVLSPPSLQNVTAIAAAFHHVCVLEADETLTCWGDLPSGFELPDDLDQ